MTIKIILSCDATRKGIICHNSIELYDVPTDKDIHGAGWHEHPDCPEDHYCDKCWPTIKQEIEAIRERDK